MSARATAADAAPGCAAAAEPRASAAAPVPGVHIRLNIPAFRLVASSGGATVASLPVSVGARGFPTPVGDFLVTEITWNPSWTPPRSRWAQGREPEPPGPQNPMGSVKMRFDSLLFLHGTPDTASIGDAASHGCVRLRDDDALRLAGWVLKATTPEPRAYFPPKGAETVMVPLDRPVRLEVVYETAELVDRTLLLHPDVYGRESDPLQLALRVLAAAGIPASESVRALLATRAPAPGQPTALIPLDSLPKEP